MTATVTKTDEPTRIDLRKRIRSRVDLLVSTPLYLVVCVIILVPLLFIVYAAVQTGSPSDPNSQMSFAGLADVFTSERYLAALRNTLWLSTLVTVFATAMGTFLALLVARTDVPGRRAFGMLIPFPIFLSPLAVGVAWVILASERSGLINVGLSKVFGGEGVLNIFSFGGLVWTMSLVFVPYAYLYTLGPLRNMDGTLEEAARVGGATVRRTILKVTLPMVTPGVVAAMLTVFVLSAEMFSIPSLIGGAAQYNTLPYLIYASANQSPANWAGAAGGGLLLLAAVVVVLLLQTRAMRQSSRFVTITGKGLKPSTIRLGKVKRRAAAGFVVLYLIVSLVLPWGALIVASFMQYLTPKFKLDLFTTYHWRTTFTEESFLQSIFNTLKIAVTTPTVTVVVGFVLAYLWARTRAPARRSMELLAIAPVAIPGIVFGVGVLWGGVNTPLYGTVWLLAIAYMARYLSHPVRLFSSMLVQVDRGLDEAARVGGAGIFRTMRSISAPLATPAALAAWLLLFIWVVRELETAVMVYTGDSIVLPVVMWNVIANSGYEAAAVVGFVQSAIVVVCFAIARWILRVDLVDQQR